MLAIFLTALPSLLKAGADTVQFVHEFRAAAQQSGEWTPEHEDAFQAALLADAQTPAQQP